MEIPVSKESAYNYAYVLHLLNEKFEHLMKCIEYEADNETLKIEDEFSEIKPIDYIRYEWMKQEDEIILNNPDEDIKKYIEELCSSIQFVNSEIKLFIHEVMSLSLSDERRIGPDRIENAFTELLKECNLYIEILDAIILKHGGLKIEEKKDHIDKRITTHKAQILILKQLGVFELAEIRDLTLEKKGEFFSKLLNMNNDNAKDYIGNIYDIKGDSGPKSPYNKQSTKQAKDILSLIDLSLS